MSMLDWGKLVSQGRAKAHGVSWSNEEGKAVAILAQTFNKPMSEVAPYVRKGILTVEDYKKAQDKPGVINPYLKLSKENLIKKAQSLGLSASPDATKEVLAQILLEEEQKQKEVAKVKAEEGKKVGEEAKIREKTEAEIKAKAEADEKAKIEVNKKKKEPKAPVKKPVSKPKAKPAKK